MPDNEREILLNAGLRNQGRRTRRKRSAESKLPAMGKLPWSRARWRWARVRELAEALVSVRVNRNYQIQGQRDEQRLRKRHVAGKDEAKPVRRVVVVSVVVVRTVGSWLVVGVNLVNQFPELQQGVRRNRQPQGHQQWCDDEAERIHCAKCDMWAMRVQYSTEQRGQIFQFETSVASHRLARMTSPHKWLLLLYGLPTKRGAARVNLWRQLKKSGALPFKTSAYLLPDRPEQNERLQWLAQQVRDSGGEATIIRVTEIEGLGNEEIVRQFNEVRAADYGGLIESLTDFIQRNKRKRSESHDSELEKLNQRFQEIQQIDYFHCPAAHDAQMLLKRAEGLLLPRTKAGAKLDAKKFAGKTWLTRPRPEIDRVGSAWLIRKFIDPKARFIFAAKPDDHSDAMPYDMFEVQFTHHGEDCTFETLLKRFGILDPAARQLGEMVHDADLEDGKFQRYECFGLDRVFKGWARLGLSDQEILAKGMECFDALHAALKPR